MRIAQKPLLMNTGGTLPTAYEQLEYIQSNASASKSTTYIDTGYMANDNSSFEFDWMPINWDNTNAGNIFPLGAYDLTTTPVLNVCPNCNTGGYNNQLTFGDINNKFLVYKVSLYTGYHMKYDKNGLLSDGILVRQFSNVEQFQMDIPIYIFGKSVKRTNGVTSPVFIAIQRIYSLKIKEGNSLMRNFIPARRKSDNEIGLYDTVTARFYENQGTGLFTGA